MNSTLKQTLKELSDIDKQSSDYMRGFRAAVEMIRDKEDRYGIGHIRSMWTGEDIADDILERVGLKEKRNE